MDAYLETYDSGAYDKYGNELTSEDQKNSMMAYLHKTEAGTTCLAAISLSLPSRSPRA